MALEKKARGDVNATSQCYLPLKNFDGLATLE
jgi:hypothetical protein